MTKEKKNSKKHIIFLMDETGSMSSIKDETVSAFNNFLQKRKARNEKETVSLIFFNSDKIKTVIKNEPIDKAELLKNSDYNPNSLTPLWDAIGFTIKEFSRLKNVLLIILTDGEENNSRKYNGKEIRKIISEKKKKNNWNFLYLGADINNFNDSDSVGISHSYKVNKSEMNETFNKVEHSVHNFMKENKIDFDEK